MTAIGDLLRRSLTGTTRIGIGLSCGEIRFVGVNHAGVPVWTRSIARGRTDVSLADEIGAGLADRPAVVRGHVRVTCVVGPNEAQLRPLHGLPPLRSTTQQMALVAQSLDRFFVGDGARMRIATPVRARDGELWAAAVNGDVVTEIAAACRAHRLRLVGVVPVAAVLGRLVPSRASSVDRANDQGDHVVRTDDGTRLHVVYDATGGPMRLWRERSDAGLATVTGAIDLHERIAPAFADAYAGTLVRSRDPFVVGEHSDEVRRARLARQRTWLWISVAAASLVAAAWAPAALALRRAERARARLTVLAPRQRELQALQTSLAASSAALGSVAGFERSRHSVTLLLAELAMALPDSTAMTTLHLDSLGGTITVLAPHAAGTLEALSAIPLIARTQMTGSVNREAVNGVDLERATLRFTLAPTARARRAAARPAVAARTDAVSHRAPVVASTPSTVRIVGASPRPAGRGTE